MGYRIPNHQPSISVVGNCPAGVDRSEAIDGGDWVTRFNNTEGFGVVQARKYPSWCL